MTARRIDIVRAVERFTSATSGVTSHHLFSFGVHYDPARISFGALTAHNEISLEPGAGFEVHEHRDVEIVTWVAEGTLVHEDSTRRCGTIVPGQVQRLTAGSGVQHSEANASADEPVRFVQMWLRSDAGPGDPSYAESVISGAELLAGLVVVATGDVSRQGGAAVSIRQPSATLLAARIGRGDERELAGAGLLHVFVVRGGLAIDGGGELARGDSAFVSDGDGVRLVAGEETEVLVWEFRDA